MDFVALDVETANADRASICQVGLVQFRGGEPTQRFSTLIDPEDWFDCVNIDIHGITEKDVEGAPTFGDSAHSIFDFVGDSTIVHHSSFDRTAIGQASQKYGIQLPEFRWLDSARVARRTWEDVKHRGFGLKRLAERIGFDFKHHDATEDAEACGRVLAEALRNSDGDLDYWIDRLSKRERSGMYGGREIAREGNPDGPCFGEAIVFTGTPSRGAKADISKIVAGLGYDVHADLKKKTAKAKPLTLVLCEQDPRKLKDDKSRKHKDAERWRDAGLEVQIVLERDFWAMADLLLEVPPTA